MSVWIIQGFPHCPSPYCWHLMLKYRVCTCANRFQCVQESEKLNHQEIWRICLNSEALLTHTVCPPASSYCTPGGFLHSWSCIYSIWVYEESLHHYSVYWNTTAIENLQGSSKPCHCVLKGLQVVPWGMWAPLFQHIMFYMMVFGLTKKNAQDADSGNLFLVCPVSDGLTASCVTAWNLQWPCPLHVKALSACSFGFLRSWRSDFTLWHMSSQMLCSETRGQTVRFPQDWVSNSSIFFLSDDTWLHFTWQINQVTLLISPKQIGPFAANTNLTVDWTSRGNRDFLSFFLFSHRDVNLFGEEPALLCPWSPSTVKWGCELIPVGLKSC